MTKNAAPTYLLGDSPDGPITFDLQRLMASRLLVQAQSGGGKSWALRRILEQTHGAIQQIIIDPEGEFSSLREKFDYVLAGKGGDTPAEPRSASMLGRRLYELGVSAIVDISELQRKDQILFVRRFCEALLTAPKKDRHALMVVVDEAHIFCPQEGHAESEQAMIDLCTLGRKRGICPVFATQRLSKLHKDAAAELRNKLIGATGLDIDQRRAGDDLGFSKADRLLLRDMAPGEFYVYGPALAPGVVLACVGPVVSHHPEIGERGLLAPPAPTARIRAMLAKLADLPAEAAEEARTVEELRAELATTRRKLTLAEKAQRIERVPEPVPCNHGAELETLREGLAGVRAAMMVHGAISDQLDRMHELGERGIATLLSLTAIPAPRPLRAVPAPRGGAPRAAPDAPAVPTSRPAPLRPDLRPDGPSTLAGPEQRVVDAIAWMESIGIEAPAQEAVCFLAGYSWGGGYFKPRGWLGASRLTELVPGNRIRLTDAGRALANVPETPLTTERLHEAVLAKLQGPERRVLAPLLPVYPGTIAQEELCALADYSWGGGFFKPRGRLRKWGLIEYMDGGIRAAAVLFPEEG